MIEEIKIEEPKEFQHNRLTIDVLLKDLETDYYGRYKFRELQQYYFFNNQGNPGRQKDKNKRLGRQDS